MWFSHEALGRKFLHYKSAIYYEQEMRLLLVPYKIDALANVTTSSN
jgi:hypothetical protein